MFTSHLAFAIALAATCSGKQQESLGELQPARDLFSDSSGLEPYYLAVREALLGQDPGRKCQLLAIPSFEREWCVYLSRDRAAPPVIVCKAMKRHLWTEMMSVLSGNGTKTEYRVGGDAGAQALQQVHIEVETSVAQVDPGTADILEQVWWRMLGRVQYSEDSSEGLDGVTYHVAHWNPGAIRCGEIWSPEEGTRAGALVELGSRMRELATAPPAARPAIERLLLQQANALSRRIDEASGTASPK